MFATYKKYVCLLIVFWIATNGFSQQASSFISISDDLVHNEVTSIIQDRKGFTWIGTRGGLQRFDGYEKKVLKYDFGKGNNLLSQSVEVLENGKNNSLWIGTKSGGLSAYNLETGVITNYTNTNANKGGFDADYILSLLDSDSEKLLVGTWRGFQYLNKKTGQFHILSSVWKTFDIQQDGKSGFWLATNSGLRHLNQELVNDYTIDFGIPDVNLTSIAIDKTNNCLWVGSWVHGLFRFDLSSKTSKNYRHQKEQRGTLSSNDAYRVSLDSKGNLWVGTWGGGLNKFKPADQSFERIHLNTPGLNTNDNQIILAIKEDASGLLWIGTDGAGVFKLDLHQKPFYNLGAKAGELLGSTHVLSVYVDPFQKLWLGTKGGGIQYSADWKTFKTLPMSPDALSVQANIYQSRSFLQNGNDLWIGTNRGLVRLQNKGSLPGQQELFLPIPKDATSISDRKINALVKDANGKIWIGTQENGLSSIIGFDKKNKPVFKNYLPSFNVKGSLQNARVSALLVDSKNRLWVGTYKGLYLYNSSADNFHMFVQSGEQGKTLSNNTILCLAEDQFGNVWVGTQYGLNKIAGLQDGKLLITSYTTREGLPNDYIHAIIPDSNGNIWLSTNKGIVRFDKNHVTVSVFDKRDGIQSNVFSENASFKDENGRFYFGGVEGVSWFEPDSISISRFAPPIYFTNLKINNEPYEFREVEEKNGILVKPFFETESITLDYDENIFEIEFAALDFRAPDKNEYMYMLEGFNPQWVYAGNNRSVSFTNLPAGTYTLKVKATNSDKVWSPVPHQLKIYIIPPPWKTWWAYTIYLVVFLFLLWLTRYFGLRQMALKNQLSISRIARQQENEISDFKERLFTNISHEFRTPLTLIMGPLEDLLQTKKLEKPIDKSLRLIQKQSKRMLRMVNQLLDFQKAKAGSLKLSLQAGEMVSFCHEIYMLFADEANRRNIVYTFHAQEKFHSITFDPNKLEIIVFNILSNAFKFTPNGGCIRLSIRRTDNGDCEITINDTGKGIPTDQLELIFDRFYRGKEEDTTTISGTGIGLSFVRELVTLHGGTIKAESDGTTGSKFTLTLPSSLQSEGKSNSANNLQIPAIPNNDNMLNPTIMQEENLPMNNMPEQPIILVAEDDADIQQYVYEILSPSFEVVTVGNGRVGVEKALELIPDLIVSDIMMPELDGIELCRKLKSDKLTSHIPIILLTALSDMAHHVQGIREGADVYLPKPFNSQLLLVHVHNLINSRNTLKELYAKKVFLGSGNFEIKTFEEEFLHKLMKLVEENISNSNFNNDELASLMFMSRSTFYRKLKAVTGMSGNEFIRTTRLNYAVKLLESGNYSVTDAAYEAGFNDIKYFRKRFQEQFSVSPSEYKK